MADPRSTPLGSGKDFIADVMVNDSKKIGLLTDRLANLIAAVTKLAPPALATAILTEAKAAPVSERPEWLIWSNEHRAWWGPNNCGYPKDVRLAGRYTLTEARAVCNSRSWDDLNVPPETMIHEQEVTGFAPSNERNST